MTRRTFLAIGALMTVAAAGAVTVARRVGPGGLRAELPRLEGFGRSPGVRLRAHYAWLAVDPAAFDLYLAGYQRYFGRLNRFSIPRADFYTRFLLCTTFFANMAMRPPGREPVRYMGFYYPAESPCYNPLAQRPPSDAELASAGSPPRG